MRGKTIGLVGYGHVGSQVGVMAEALSIKVLFYDTVSIMPIGNAVAVTSMSELLAQSDFVVVNVTSSLENKHLMGKEQFELMKKGAFFINAGYGDVADHQALAQAIKSGHLGGAAIDTYPEETLPKKGQAKLVSPLQGLRNVILTPSYGILLQIDFISYTCVATLTREAAIREGSETTSSIVRYIRDGTTFGSINFPSVAAWYLKKGSCRIVCMHKNIRGVLRVRGVN